VPGLTNATEVTAGFQHSCALLSSGHVDCWGVEGAFFYQKELSPREVNGIGTAVEVSIAGFESCALLSNGHVECWGEAEQTPYEVPGLTSATQIAAGSEHWCALLSDGHVDCWGRNQYGQLGDGKTDNPEKPVEVHGAAEVPGLSGVSQIAAGDGNSCALLTSGHIDCWGYNYYGELGNGTTTESDTPVEVWDVTAASQVAVGGTSSCLVLVSSRVECWGANEHGQLGNGTDGANSDIPAEVQRLSDATQIATGYPHSCALLSSSRVECWGDGESGQLGDDTIENSQRPVEVDGLSSVIQIAAASSYSCALLSSGHVECWGSNEAHQLGDGANGGHAETPVEVKGLTGAVQIAAGGGGACAVLSSGHLACWGVIDDGTTERALTPVEIPGIATASQVAVGEDVSCVVLTNGHVDCWGGNSRGQLGDGSSGGPLYSLAEVQSLSDAIQVAAGDEYACALVSGGHVDCWGGAGEGQLGDGTTSGPEFCSQQFNCSTTPIEVQGLSGAVQLAVGGSDACALLPSGHADCWGVNENGQLGAGDHGEDSATPVEVAGLGGITQIAPGGGDSCALLSSGHIDCWGASNRGALGNGLAWSSVPTAVSSFPTIPATGGPSSGTETPPGAPAGQAASSQTPTAGVEGTSATSAGSSSTGQSTYASLLSLVASATRGGKLQLTLACSRGRGPCTGTVALLMLAPAGRHKGRAVLLGSARYTLDAALSATVTLSLTSYAKALLARRHVLHANALTTPVNGAEHTTRLVIRSASLTHARRSA
jgi:alpha-tubulin suppressor-like RCC1 family protein